MYNCHPGAYFLNNFAAAQGNLEFATYAEIRNGTCDAATFSVKYTDITRQICDSAHIIHFVGASKPWREGYDGQSVYFKYFGDVYRRIEEEYKNEADRHYGR